MLSQAIPLGPSAKLEVRHCGLEPDAPPSPRGSLGCHSSLALAPGHRPVLDAIEGLAPGEAIRINVDHDPSPLLDFVELTAPGRFAWEALLEGPDRWVGLLRRRSPTAASSARSLSSSLAQRAAAIGARGRLEREIREIALDLLGPGDAAGLSRPTSAWASAAAESVVASIRDGSLTALLGALDAQLAAAPESILVELVEARARGDVGAL